jgi:DNA-binding NarL/FixJ family response regulator
MNLMLEPYFEVVGEAQNGLEALPLVEALRPDVVILDIRMPIMDGVTAVKRLRAACPSCTIVVLSIYDDAQTQAQMQVVGAAAFVSKRESPATLTIAIRRLVGKAT